MAQTPPLHRQNRLLAACAPPELALLAAHLVFAPFAVRDVFEEPGKPFKSVYFITSGFASVVAAINHDKRVEVGLIGREGMTGSSLVLNSDRSPHETYAQAPGDAWSMSATTLRGVLDDSSVLRGVLGKFAHAFMIQVAHTAVANAQATIEQRLARWLLMAQDRLGAGSALPLTHEFLSLMLAVRRAGVTVAVQALEAKGMIDAGRGVILILDRDALKQLAGAFYGAPEAELKRLMN